MNTKRLCQAAVVTALVFVVTRFIQVPIPLGYFNIGNSVILLCCLLLPLPYGTAAAGIGSALADLTSYAVYALPTLLIKLLFPLVYYLISQKKPESAGLRIAAAAVSTLIPLVGYTITGAVLYGSIYTGLAQVPGLLIEYAANLVIFLLLQKQFLQLKKYLG